MNDKKRVSAYDILSDVGQIFQPPKRNKVSETVAKNMMIATPGGYSGLWSPDVTPYMREPMDLLTSREFNSVIFCGPSRGGKTNGLIDGGIANTIMADPSDILVIHMTEAAARKYSRLRVSRMLNNSPALKSKMSTTRHDDNILGKYFKNGTALIIGWPSPTQLSAQDYKYVFLSDYDRMADDTGEGSVYTLALKRGQTFMSGAMCCVESSPGRDFNDHSWKPKSPHDAPPVGGVLGLYNSGDKRLYNWNCPYCAGKIKLRPGLELFNLPNTKQLIEEIESNGTKSTAKKYNQITCPNCGSMIDHSHKRKMNINGFWEKENDNPNNIASFWQSGLSAAFQTWDSLLEKEFKAIEHYAKTGGEEMLKATRNTDQGIPYFKMSGIDALTGDDLERRAEDLPKRIVPSKARALFAAVDVQATRFVVQVEAMGVNKERWIIDRFDIDHAERESNGGKCIIDPAGYQDDWLVLVDSVINKRYPIEGSSEDLGIIFTCCDSGGKMGVTENAYLFWKHCENKGLSERFAVVKGINYGGSIEKPMIVKSILEKQSNAAVKAKVVGRLPLYLINTTRMKDHVHANLRKREAGKDYIHFPDWLGSWWYSELMAETRTDKGWINAKSQRNETLDLMVYCRAAFLIKMMSYWKDSINWAKPPTWLCELKNNSMSSYNLDKTKKNVKRTTRSTRMRVK